MTSRMLLFASVDPAGQEEFEAAFRGVRQRVATVRGHIFDELLRQQDRPGAYVLSSQWESKEAFLTWLRSPDHDEMTAPMHPYFQNASEMRFYECTDPAMSRNVR